MKHRACLTLCAILFATPAFADQGAWKNETQKSALTDVTSVYWALEAENTVPDMIGMQHAPILAVICTEKETRVLFKVHDYMGMEPITMAYRIDGGAIKKTRAAVSVDGRLFGFWNGTGVPFLKSLKGKSKLIVSASPWGQGPSEAIFNIDGVNTMMADVGKTCGW